MPTHFNEPFPGSFGIEKRKVYCGLIDQCPVGGIWEAS